MLCFRQKRQLWEAKRISACERPKSSSNLQGNRLILYLQSILGYLRSSPNTVCKECPPTNITSNYKRLQRNHQVHSSAILQPSFRIMTIDYIVFKNSPLGGRLSVSQIVCTAWEPLEMARKRENLQNFLDFFFGLDKAIHWRTSRWNFNWLDTSDATHDSFQIGPHSARSKAAWLI